MAALRARLGVGGSTAATCSFIVEAPEALPVNSSGGLIDGGHPDCATGIRMLVDAAAHRLVTAKAKKSPRA